MGAVDGRHTCDSTFASTPDKSFTFSRPSRYVYVLSHGGSGEAVTDYCLQFEGNWSANCSSVGETGTAKSRLLSDYPVICFPQMFYAKTFIRL